MAAKSFSIKQSVQRQHSTRLAHMEIIHLRRRIERSSVVVGDPSLFCPSTVRTLQPIEQHITLARAMQFVHLAHSRSYNCSSSVSHKKVPHLIYEQKQRSYYNSFPFSSWQSAVQTLGDSLIGIVSPRNVLATGNDPMIGLGDMILHPHIFHHDESKSHEMHSVDVHHCFLLLLDRPFHE